MATWLVSLGKTLSQAHEEEYGSLCDAYVADDFIGERQLIGLLMAGWGPIRIGTKEMLFNATTQKFYFQGPTAEWTPDELILLTVLVLSDALVCDKFNSQGSHFLVVNFRAHRQELGDEDRQILKALEENDELVKPKGPVKPAAVLPVTVSSVAVKPGSTQVAAQLPEKPLPKKNLRVRIPLLTRMKDAGNVTVPTLAELEIGIPEARLGLAKWFQSHEL